MHWHFPLLLSILFVAHFVWCLGLLCLPFICFLDSVEFIGPMTRSNFCLYYIFRIYTVKCSTAAIFTTPNSCRLCSLAAFSFKILYHILRCICFYFYFLQPPSATIHRKIILKLKTFTSDEKQGKKMNGMNEEMHALHSYARFLLFTCRRKTWIYHPDEILCAAEKKRVVSKRDYFLHFLRRTKTIFMEKCLFSLAIFNFNFVVN